MHGDSTHILTKHAESNVSYLLIVIRFPAKDTEKCQRLKKCCYSSMESSEGYGSWSIFCSIEAV